MALSKFPEEIDSIKRLRDYPQSQANNIKRYIELRNKTNLTTEEQDELSNLTQILDPYMINAEDWNLVAEAIENSQEFFKENVDVYIDNKKIEIETYTNGKVTLVNDIVSEGIDAITSKRDYFITFVNTKEDEVRALVQEFDSNTARYYTTWTATEDGQTDFNIYQGSNKNLPTEANLNIPVENIDLIINGVVQTPYIDYVVHSNGFYDTIRLTSNAQSLIQIGTEIVAKWYKNVGKLYFKHASSHAKGGTDELTVTQDMFDNELQERMKNIIYVGLTPPNSDEFKFWLDTSV